MLNMFASLFEVPATDPTSTFWIILTDVIVAGALITAAIFAVVALVQWWRRKSFFKIDRELRWTLLPLGIMAATYVVFEKFIVLATRPNGSGEPSFPATHTMLTATIFFLAIQLLPKYLHNRAAVIILDVLMLVAVILVAVGRVIANMHWPTDVLGGIIFSGIFATIYAIIINTTPKASIDSKGVAHLK